jgi:hypothetical protein
VIIFFGRFMKISEVAQIYGTTFSQCICSLFILTKTDWATFWATFSQTDLVTLVLSILQNAEVAHLFEPTLMKAGAIISSENELKKKKCIFPSFHRPFHLSLSQLCHAHQNALSFILGPFGPGYTSVIHIFIMGL